jgi:hypothetical protein
MNIRTAIRQASKISREDEDRRSIGSLWPRPECSPSNNGVHRGAPGTETRSPSQGELDPRPAGVAGSVNVHRTTYEWPWRRACTTQIGATFADAALRTTATQARTRHGLKGSKSRPTEMFVIGRGSNAPRPRVQARRAVVGAVIARYTTPGPVWRTEARPGRNSRKMRELRIAPDAGRPAPASIREAGHHAGPGPSHVSAKRSRVWRTCARVQSHAVSLRVMGDI